MERTNQESNTDQKQREQQTQNPAQIISNRNNGMWVGVIIFVFADFMFLIAFLC